MVLKQRNYQLRVNGYEVSADYEVKDMDKIEFKDMPAYYRIKDIVRENKRKRYT